MNILITGASKGIGYQLVKKLAADPANTIVAVARSAENLKKLEEECLQVKAANIYICVLDLSSEDLSSLLKILQKLERIDLLINNAGLLINKSFDDMLRQDWVHTFDTNLFSVVNLLKAVKPFLINAENAHVVNIGSMGGFQGSSKFPGLAAYSSAKGALAILTECLAEEWKNDGISVNCLCLGAVNTEMLASAFPGYKAPLDAVEMAEFIADFATKAHRFMNGKIIPVALSDPG